MIVYKNRQQLLTWGLGILVLALAAIGIRLYVSSAETETLPGGGWVGLSYGIIGGLLILFALSLTFLRFVPSWWFIGTRAFWLKGHIWLGSLSFILILCHTGTRLGGTFETILYVLFMIVVVTGIFGVALQQFLPRWITVEVPCEVPFEQIPKVCATLRDKADMEMDENCASPVPATTERLNRWYTDVMRPFLAWPFDGRNPLSDGGKASQIFAEMRGLAGVGEPMSALLARLEEYGSERRRLERQERLHRLLHGWLYVHIPVSWAMTVMMLAHAIMATLYYHQ